MDILIVVLLCSAVFALSFTCLLRSGFKRLKKDMPLGVLYPAIRFSAIWIVVAVAYAAIARELYFILLLCALVVTALFIVLVPKVNSKRMMPKRTRFVLNALKNIFLVIAIGLALVWLVTLVL